MTEWVHLKLSFSSDPVVDGFEEVIDEESDH